MNTWFLRMAHWVRHPPSIQRVKIVLAVVVICIGIVGIEELGWWPDWATAERIPFRGPFR